MYNILKGTLMGGEEMRLLFIGDSMINGYGVPTSKSWLNLVQSESQEAITDSSTNGATSSDLLLRVQEDLHAFSPDYVFLMAGTNDALKRRTANTIFNNVQEMVRTATDAGVTPIVMLQPVMNVPMANELWGGGEEDFTEASTILKRYRRLIADYCQDEQIEIIDFQEAFHHLEVLTLPEKYYLDGIHMTEHAHRKLADLFLYRFNHILLHRNPVDYMINFDTATSSK